MYYYDVQSYEESKADVKARRAALKASGHVVADKLVPLSKCCRENVENAGLPRSGVTQLEVVVRLQGKVGPQRKLDTVYTGIWERHKDMNDI